MSETDNHVLSNAELKVLKRIKEEQPLPAKAIGSRRCELKKLRKLNFIDSIPMLGDMRRVLYKVSKQGNHYLYIMEELV